MPVIVSQILEAQPVKLLDLLFFSFRDRLGLQEEPLVAGLLKRRVDRDALPERPVKVWAGL